MNDICFFSPDSADTSPPEDIANFHPLSDLVIVIGSRFETQRSRPETASEPSMRGASGSGRPFEAAPLTAEVGVKVLGFAIFSYLKASRAQKSGNEGYGTSSTDDSFTRLLAILRGSGKLPIRIR